MCPELWFGHTYKVCWNWHHKYDFQHCVFSWDHLESSRNVSEPTPWFLILQTQCYIILGMLTGTGVFTLHQSLWHLPSVHVTITSEHPTIHQRNISNLTPRVKASKLCAILWSAVFSDIKVYPRYILDLHRLVKSVLGRWHEGVIMSTGNIAGNYSNDNLAYLWRWVGWVISSNCFMEM